jgi:hypothetical protein
MEGNMDRNEALKIWEHEYGNVQYAHDFAGRKVKRDDYLEKNQVGWVVGYMRPLSKKGTTDIGNVIIMHHHTESEKGNAYPEFTVDEEAFVVRYENTEDYYYIERVDDDDEDDDEDDDD